MGTKGIIRIVKRCTAVFFTWTAIAIAMYGISIFRLELLVMAGAWYFIGGGLLVQSIEDIEQAFEDNGF